jgi:ATP-dependent Clp protease adapter protein ClpS
MTPLTMQDVLAHQASVPWPELYQVEQDLLLSLSMRTIFDDPFLSAQVAMRGGTVLHKIHLAPAARYSEDDRRRHAQSRARLSDHLGRKGRSQNAERSVSQAATTLTRTVMPPDTSLISIPEFVPPGFIQGIEILNDNTSPMKFVADVLATHAGLSPEESNRTMLAIHTRGGALIPAPSTDDARRMAAQIAAEAARQGYPLICRPVSISRVTVLTCLSLTRRTGEVPGPPR